MKAIIANSRWGRAELTAEHACSSYGQPVLVIAGQAYGPLDLLRLEPLNEYDPEPGLITAAEWCARQYVLPAEDPPADHAVEPYRDVFGVLVTTGITDAEREEWQAKCNAARALQERFLSLARLGIEG